MTTAKKPKIRSYFRLPDPPEREPEEMTSAKHLAESGNIHHINLHLGHPETTIVKSELYLMLGRLGSGSEFRVPGLLIAFNADPELYEHNNGYVISEQGKQPDFVLEIVSPGSRRADRVDKREDYAALGIPEYWRFDEAARQRENRLAGDRLVDGVYEPIAIEELADGVLQGYSAELNLYLRWEQGQLRLHDPATGQHIPTFESERARADRARELCIQERDTRLASEARVRELEERLGQQNACPGARQTLKVQQTHVTPADWS